MSEEYHIIQGKLPNGDLQRKLIELETLRSGVAELGLDSFFVPGTTDITELGVVQIVGDIHFLDDEYVQV